MRTPSCLPGAAGRCLATFAVVLAVSCHPHGTSLAYLDQFVGKDPASVDLWTSEPLRSDLREQVGEQYAAFMKDMARAVPLRKDTVLYTYSKLAPDTVPGIAYLLIDTRTNKFQAGIYTSRSIQTFQSPGEAFSVPRDLQALLDSIR